MAQVAQLPTSFKVAHAAHATQAAQLQGVFDDIWMLGDEQSEGDEESKGDEELEEPSQGQEQVGGGGGIVTGIYALELANAYHTAIHCRISKAEGG